MTRLDAGVIAPGLWKTHRHKQLFMANKSAVNHALNRFINILITTLS